MKNKLARISKEITDFRLFFEKIPKKDKEIVFYAENEGYYSYFEGLIKELTQKYNQTLCYVTSDANDSILKKTDSRIRTFYLDKLLPFFMAFVNSKIFVMTLPDLNQFHLKRSVNPVHYVYMFHNIVSTHMVFRYGSFDYYDSIFCGGPHHVKEIRRHEELNHLKPKKLVETGYYRLERIYNEYQNHSFSKPGVESKGTILIAPSWGVANIIETCGEQLVSLLLKAGYEVIVRPHPETIKHFPESIDLLANAFGNNPKFTLERSVASDTSLLIADVLISDYSGIALEYAFATERPVLFIDVPPKIRNKKFNELGIEPLELALRPQIGTIISPNNLKDVTLAIYDLLKNKEMYKNSLVELRKQHMFAFGYSSKIGAQYIIDLAAGKNP